MQSQTTPLKLDRLFTGRYSSSVMGSGQVTETVYRIRVLLLREHLYVGSLFIEKIQSKDKGKDKFNFFNYDRRALEKEMWAD